MTREKLINLSKNLISDKDNYMSSFHKNMDMYVSQPDLTIREIAEMSGLPFSTINTFLYGSSKDCKLSTAISLSKAMQVSVDELIGCNTLSSEERSLLQAFRSFAPRIRYLVCWFVDFQKMASENSGIEKDRYITVMDPRMDEDGNLFPTNDFTTVNIKECSRDIKSQVFLGISVTCSYYMPSYSPYDILLIANDRPPKLNEDCVILFCGKLYLARRIQTVDGAIYHSIRDEHLSITETEIDYILGYVAGVKLDNAYLNL